MRREILDMFPSMRVRLLNGPVTQVSLLKLRKAYYELYDGHQDFFSLGQMRIGFHWREACVYAERPADAN